MTRRHNHPELPRDGNCGRHVQNRVPAPLCALLCVTSLAQAGPPPAIAIGEFSVIGKVRTEEAGQAVAELLMTRVDSRRYRLVERMALKAILDEHDLTIAGIVSNPKVLKSRKLRGVRYVVVGSIVQLPDDLTIVARLVDVTTGEVVQAAQVRTSGLYQLSDNLHLLAARLDLVPMPPPRSSLMPPSPKPHRLPDDAEDTHYERVSHSCRKTMRESPVRPTRRPAISPIRPTTPRVLFNRYDSDSMAYAEIAARYLAARLNRSRPPRQDIALFARAQDTQYAMEARKKSNTQAPPDMGKDPTRRPAVPPVTTSSDVLPAPARSSQTQGAVRRPPGARS